MAVSSGDQTSELLIGGGILLVVAAAGVYVVRSWQSPAETGDKRPETEEADDASRLIQTIANLDDAFEAGQVEEATYQADRQRLLSALKAVWE